MRIRLLDIKRGILSAEPSAPLQLKTRAGSEQYPASKIKVNSNKGPAIC